MLTRSLAALALALSGAADPSGFTFDDTRIDEASALVALPGDLFATINDSGDTGRVFTVDAHGRTVGVTQWEQSPRDVEALTPDPDGELWVGDIGDNSESRPHVQVARVPAGRGDRTVHPTVYTLVYPDGAHDAETLLCDPATGRLYIAAKGWLGGTLYAAPEHLDPHRENRLTPAGAVMPMATDGVFLPGGHEVLIRGYFSATTYAWPSMDKIASFPLPDQPQGEGVGVTQDGVVYLSSEGLHSRVVPFELPARASTGSANGGTSANGGVSSDASTGSANGGVEAQPTDHADAGRPWWPWALGGLAGVLAIGVLLRSLRPR